MKRYIFISILLTSSIVKAVSYSTPTVIIPVRVPWTDVMNYGAKGDCLTDDQAAINNAIQAQEATSLTSAGTVLFPQPVGGCYLLSQDIVISSMTNGLHLIGYPKYVSLHFNSPSGNGIRFLGNHDNFIAENLDLYSTSNSTGYAIVSTNTMSASPLRDFEFRNINFEFFSQGIVLGGNLNGKIIGGRQGGQGKNSGHGYSGIQLGIDVNHSGNGTQVENVYVSNFDIGLNVKYAEPVNLVGLNLFGGCSTGVYVGPTSILVEAGEINFDSFNDVAIENDGYLNYAAAYSSLGSQSLNTTTHRMFNRGHSLTNIEAYITTSPIISPNSFTLAHFDGVNENTESFFSTTTYLYTATYPGYRFVTSGVRFDVSASTSEYQIGIYVNGSQVKQSAIWGPSGPPASSVITVSIDDLVWLNVGDTVGIYIYQNQPGTTTVHGNNNNNWLTITDE